MNPPLNQKSNNLSSRPWFVGTICLFLALSVWIVFGQTRHHQFVNFDDNAIVYENPEVSQGLSLHAVAWAFTHTVVGNWNPLTILSHQLDCQLYGLHPVGHHLTNVFLHGLTAILLFLVLQNMTGALWRSALVAAIFAIHPLRVESVAWVAERKDVLSGLFFMLTLWAYGGYVEKFKIQNSKFKVYYGLALLFFALGLMAKPMLVTLPFVLLLLDYWPLRRMDTAPANRITALIYEKIPFLVLSVADCLVTVLAQGKAADTIAHLSLGSRLGNALESYAAYLGQMFFPVGLAAYYPHPGKDLLVWKVVLSAFILLTVSAGVVAWRRKYPVLLIGWLWYLGMLVPAIGLVQVGSMARADRYTYLPQIGLYVMVVWGLAECCARWRWRNAILGPLAAAVLAVLMMGASIQTSYWQDSVTLWTRTLACTSKNLPAHNNLGNAFLTKRLLAQAGDQFAAALKINPDFAPACNNFGLVLARQGKLDEAIPYYQRALRLNPDDPETYFNLANSLADQGKIPEAIAQFERAIQLRPDYAEAHDNLALALAFTGKQAEAVPHFERAIALQQDGAAIRYNLGNAWAAQGKLPEAIGQYLKAIHFKPDYVEAYDNLANALATLGRPAEAIPNYERALQLKPDDLEAHYNLGRELAVIGRVGEGRQHLQQALQLAVAQNNTAAAKTIRTQLETPPFVPEHN